jgi:hypothetical protein
MSDLEYLIGIAPRPYGNYLCIGYCPWNSNERTPLIAIRIGKGRNSESWCLSPSRILERRPHIFHYEVVEGVAKMVKIAEEPPGWFARRCAETKCEWFVPFVERMAAGEEVPLEEIQAAYRIHNEGQEMPSGSWNTLFK